MFKRLWALHVRTEGQATELRKLVLDELRTRPRQLVESIFRPLNPSKGAEGSFALQNKLDFIGSRYECPQLSLLL